MFARLSTYQGAPVPAGAQPSQNAVQILEQIRKVPGFQGLYLLVDPSTGKSMSLTLWEDEQTMGASETEGTRIREESAKREGERIVGFGTHQRRVVDVADHAGTAGVRSPS